MTAFSTIEDLALVTIQDYKLDSLYKSNPTDWETFIAGFVVRASLLFDNSRVDLSYDLDTLSFNADLGSSEILVLVYLFIQMWIERVQQKLSDLVPTMTPSDAKRTGISTVMKERQEMLNQIREKTSQLMVDYGKHSVNWQDWGNGVFN